MTTASKLLEKYSPKSNDGIHIDYLCFTFKLKDLRHCFYAIGDRSPENKFTPSRKSLLKRTWTSPQFPSPPQLNPITANSPNDIDSVNDFYRRVNHDYYEQCLRIFVNQVLGLSLSAPRGLGFQFYEDSMNLLSPDGADYCGKLGIGGNQETVHLQINATGCKHMFNRSPAFVIHDWLSNVLGVKALSRIDLAYDDFDGVFDCDYAMKAVYDDAFRTAVRGRSPSVEPDNKFSIDFSTGEKRYSKEQLLIGSRTSRVYWRIYNKALEQNLSETGLIWYRSEVELKKWDIDALLNPAGAFAAINDFSASIATSEAFDTKPKASKRAALDLLSKAYWLKRQYGPTLNSLIKFHGGRLDQVMGLLHRGGNRFDLPDVYGRLVSEILKT
ncbi:replication initiation factor domain-containing protein [Vibrio penaeicida]|uniref:replication initiation factor domain-containing protein n=1 Tax=Vibrio penaeicida TaxID=104609 RepID=UPI002735818A|nr:replication initiation factor domain-containing protein [Vibrio penaeicida]MDP2571669.1 replication initiation factor domain-containing protein [Vibrio penaeicida]